MVSAILSISASILGSVPSKIGSLLFQNLFKSIHHLFKDSQTTHFGFWYISSSCFAARWVESHHKNSLNLYFKYFFLSGISLSFTESISSLICRHSNGHNSLSLNHHLEANSK
jgi:hypothetical protein